MGIVITSNFTVNTNLPIDDREVAADVTARDAIGSTRRYIGLKVFCVAEAKTFVLKTGIANGDWVEDGGSGSGVTTVADLTARNNIVTSSVPLAPTAGMLVYVTADGNTYQLKGGITNGDWVLFSGRLIVTLAAIANLTTIAATNFPCGADYTVYIQGASAPRALLNTLPIDTANMKAGNRVTFIGTSNDGRVEFIAGGKFKIPYNFAIGLGQSATFELSAAGDFWPVAMFI